MTIQIDIAIEADAWAGEQALNKLAQKAVNQTFAHIKMPDCASELSVLLTHDSQIQEINAEWRGQDKPTNVLSFPAQDLAVGDAPGLLLGDIIIAFETVQREAALESKRFDDHLTHLIVHGLLHLLGYDHEDDADAELMEKTETDILAAMGISDPYAIEAIGS